MKSSYEYLDINSIQTNRILSRLLPPDLARRYHALPIATDGHKVTIAISHPEDINAQDAIKSVIATPVCLVRAEEQLIDKLIEEILPKEFPQPSQVLVGVMDSDRSADVIPYAKKIAGLLGGKTQIYIVKNDQKTGMRELVSKIEQEACDLAIINFPEKDKLQHSFARSLDRIILKNTKSALLVAKHPRLPLKKILLVVYDPVQDESALDWTIHLAYPSAADITILPLIPPTPKIFNGLAGLQHQLPSLLASQSPLGEELLTISKRLTELGITGKIKLRNEMPLEQIYCEIEEETYDLIVMVADRNNPLLRWFSGSMINPLLCEINCSMLITNAKEQ